MGNAVSQLLGGAAGPNGYGFHTTTDEVMQGLDLTSINAIVTGPTSGIGLETSRSLVKHGALVVLAARNIEAANNVKNNLIGEFPFANIRVLEIDLASLSSVKNAAEEFNTWDIPLHILINNAGIMLPGFAKSADGLELQFATNHLGHFLFTNLLLENMTKTAQTSGNEGRIVNVSSSCYRLAKHGIQFKLLGDPSCTSAWYPLGYGVSKLANILHAKELAKRLKEQGSNVTANAVHPGAVATKIVPFTIEYLSYIVTSIFSRQFEFRKPLETGAATTCYVATHPNVSGVSGQFFVNCNKVECVLEGNNMELARELWEFSDNIVKQAFHHKQA